MNTLRNVLIWSFIVCTVIPSFAAADMFLKIEGAKGYSKIIQLDRRNIHKKGITKVENFKAGTYTFTITNKLGQAMTIEDKPMRRWATIQFSAQTASESYAKAVIAGATETSDDKTACMECSPEIFIEKAISAGAKFSETVEIVVDGILLVDFSGFFRDGSLMFAEDWVLETNQETLQ